MLIVSLSVNFVRADETKSINGRLIGGVGLGGGLPVNGFGSAYTGGGGIDGYLGIALDKNLSLTLAIDSFIFHTNNPAIFNAEVNFAPGVKCLFGDSGTKLFLLGSLGMNSNILYVESTLGTSTLIQRNFMVEPGAGVQIFLNDALDFYFQVKYVNVFAPSAFSYVPISAGLDFK